MANLYGGYKTPAEYTAAIKRVEASGGNFQRPEEAKAFKAANPQYFTTTPTKTVTTTKTTTPVKTTNLYGGYKTPQEYADAIKRVEASGGNFQRPEEAMAFKQANPGLFAQLPPVDFGVPLSVYPPENILGQITKNVANPYDYTKNPLYQQQVAQAQAQQKQINDLMAQLQTEIATPFNPESSPQYNVLQKLAEQQAAKGSQNAMETLNARGILNSSITGDNVAQIQQEAMTGLNAQTTALAQQEKQQKLQNIFTQLGALTGQENTIYGRGIEAGQLGGEQSQTNLQNQTGLYEILYTKQLQDKQVQIEADQVKVDNAIKKLDTLGYVDNETSKILGIPVGTPSAQAKQFAMELAQQLKIAQMNNATALQQLTMNAGLTQQELGLKKDELSLARDKLNSENMTPYTQEEVDEILKLKK